MILMSPTPIGEKETGITIVTVKMINAIKRKKAGSIVSL
jgi:hypothetical protein